MKKNTFDFEKSIARLDEIAAAMEKRETSLDESLALFEEGMKLSSECAAKLEEIRGRIYVLKGDGSAGETEEFGTK